MANASKFLEEIEKQKKKKKERGEDTSSLDPIAPTTVKTAGGASNSRVVDAFYDALNTEREKQRQRESLSDIAPVKTTVGTTDREHGGRSGSFTVKSEEDDSLLDFFQKGAFSDGYQIGDVTKTILGTVGDIGVGAVKGVMKMGEGIGDAAQYVTAAAADALGGDEWADNVRKNAQRTAVDDAFAPVDKKLDKYSVLGRTSDATAEALGQIGAIIMTGGLAAGMGAGTAGATAATTGVMGVSSFGSSTSEAYKGGAEEGEAELYGAIAGTADAVSELIFGGLGKAVGAVGLSKGLSSADDILARKVSEKITNTIAKNAVELGIKAGAEGTEEVLAGLAQAAGKKLTYMSEEEIGQIIADENLLEQFVVGAIASGVAQAPNISQSNKAGEDFITGRTKNEQAVIDRVVEQRIKDAEADGTKLKPKQRQEIEEQAAADMERGRIEIDTIEEVLGGEEYKAYQDAVKEEDALRREYEELGALKEPTLAEKTRYEELHAKKSEIFSDERRTALKTKVSERVSEMARADRLSQSYAERQRRGEYFEDDVTKYTSDAAKKTVQNLVDAKLANNTGRTHEMAASVAKIAEDKGIVFNFTNNQKLRESGKTADVAENAVINGYKDAEGITVNLDSPKAWQFIVGHEVTHTLEGTAEYTELANAVKVYAQTKGEYDSRREGIASLYSEDTDVDSELTSDMIGEYIFTDEQFVNELSTKHQNVFQRVFAEIKHLLKMVTAGSKEARQLEKVKHTFEKAYRAQQTAGADAGVQKSLSDPATDKTYLDAVKRNDTETAQRLVDEIADKAMPDSILREGAAINKGEDEEGTLIRMYHGSGANDFNTFEPRDGMLGKGVYLTSNWDEAVGYALDKLGIEENDNGFYEWNGEEYDGIGGIGEALEGAGYVRAFYANVTDESDISRSAVYWEDVIALVRDTTQLKSADAVTYDDNGNVIPLSERYKAGDSDIRYSLSRDSEGKELTEGQREYFRESKVTDENGNLKVMYHGTPNGDFTVFRDGTYFTDSREYADKYQQPGASSLSVKKDASNPKTFEVYLDIKKPFDLSDPEAREIYINDYIKGGNAVGINPYLSDAEYDKITAIDWTEGEDLREFLQDNGYDYDGLILDEGGTGGYGDNVEYRGKSYVVFSPEQVKNVDNTAPTADADIRYSLTKDSGGKELTKEQREYFKNTKVVDDDGNLKVMYHGTSHGGFHVFDPDVSDDGISLFFTDSNEVASSYSGTNETYAARTFRTADDFNVFFEEIGAREYSAAEEMHGNHKWFVLYEDGTEIASSETANGLYEEFRDWSGLGEGAVNYEVYLNLTNPLEVDAEGKDWNMLPGVDDSAAKYDYIKVVSVNDDRTVTVEYAMTGDAGPITETVVLEDRFDSSLAETLANMAPGEQIDGADANPATTREYAKYAKEHGYDGVIIKNVYDIGGYGIRPKKATVAIAFDAAQVKSAANDMPTGDSDIRFSLSAPVEESKNLIAVHNLNADKLLKALDLGGMPMPSIAIAKAEGGHEAFGDISLVFDKSTIDPQASAANKVYSGDAWTPTYPTVEYKVNDAVEKRLSDKYYALAGKVGYDELRALYPYANNPDETLNRNGGEQGMLQRLYDDTGVMQIYLQDTGRGKVEPVTHEVRTEITADQAQQNQFMIDALGADLVAAFGQPGDQNLLKYRIAYMQEHEAEIRDAYKRMFVEQEGFSAEDAEAIVSATTVRGLMGIVRDAYQYTKNQGVTVKVETDTAATNDAIRAAAADGYREWVDSLFGGIQEKSGIRNNQDAYTKSGNRRSWDATHYEATLENIVLAMKESGEKGLGGLGVGNILGASTQEFSSVADIKGASDRLQSMPQEQFDEIKHGFTDRFYQLTKSLPKNQDSFTATDDAANTLVEAITKYKTKKGIDGYLRRELSGWANYSPAVTEELVSLVNDIRAMPTQYFEAKPQRAVGFDEVAVFVIPRNADVKVKQELLNRGYSIAEYDPDIEGDRAKVLNSFEQYKFSLSDAAAPVGGRGVAARDLRYQGEDIAPVAQEAPAQQAAEASDDIAPIPGEHSEIDRLHSEYEAARAEFDGLSAQVQELYSELTPEEQEQAMEAVLASGERLKAAQDALNAAQQDSLASYTDADVPPEPEAPYYGEEDALPMPDDPMADRDEKEVGKRSVKAYQYLNPEVKPYFRAEAEAMIGDLRRSTRGERFVNYNTGAQGSTGEWTGQERVLAYDLAGLKDQYGYSYAQLEKGIQAIIDDEGAENNAVSKRIELLIHDRLAKGYVDAYSGVEIPANTEYLDFLRDKQITEYNDAAFDALVADGDAYIPPITEDIAPVAESLAGVSSAVDTEVEEIDAPVADTAEVEAAVSEIQTTYDKILAKKQNAEATLQTHKTERAARAELYKNRIDELQRKLDGKKRKDTKAAVKLAQQITRVRELAANVDADYAKRISDAEKRIARRDFELNQDHTEADKLERAYAKIDQQLATDRAAVEAEFAQRREELTAAVADKNDYISSRAMELYNEITHLKKGVRASYELGYLLDRGYTWNSIKSTLLKVNRNPDYIINPDSAEESDIRAMLTSEYSSKAFEIGELDGEMQDRLAQLEADAEKQKAEVRKGEQQLRRSQHHQNLVDGMKNRFAVSGYDLDMVLKDAKNLSTFATVDNTPQRVMEKALGYKQGQILADLTVNRTAQNETEGIRWLNQYTDPKNGLIARISRQYHIKPGSKQSAAAQMYAEGFYVNEYNEIIAYGDRELASDFPDARVQANIKGLARDGRIRAIYDETLDSINESRVRNAYPEIPKRDNYFLHFRAMEDTFSTLGLPFNPNDIKAKDLPTDLNGVTADLKPGQPYFASAMQRKGKRTSFDLLGGLEKYLSSAKNQIYHIDDIQTLRALRNYIADDYGQATGLDSLDTLSEEEVQERIKDVFGSHLSTFAKFLNEQANVVAGKTSLADRGIEGIIGRRGITFLNDLNRQVGANMVGYNVSSSLTNFIAPVQAFAKMNKTAFVRGFAQTVSNRIGGIFGRGDSFAADSSVMIRREGEKRFHRTAWQRMSDPGYLLMGAVDSLSTEIIARGKYNELTAKGMSAEQAHIETDKWVSRLMGDRSLGQQPHLYNSKMLGLVTKFQLEVRNQLDSQFYDTIKEAEVSTETIENARKRNAVKAAKIASTFATLAVGQHIFGQVFESIAGYNPAFDIIEAIAKAVGWDDDEDDDDTVLDNLTQGLISLAEDMPYYSILSGGRVPIESALPLEQLIKGKDSYGNDKSRLETLGEAAPYYVLPGGYGQIKKTVQGLSMYSDEHPVAGSYTDSGNMRFPVGTEPLDVAQAAVFGQYSSANARDYFDDERKPLSEKQVTEYAAADMTIQEYWDYRDGLKEHDNLAAQAEYINSLDIPTWKKNLFINNLTDRKEAIDMADYSQYGSLSEMDFAKKSPEKYRLLQEQGVTYEQFTSFDDKTKNAYSWAAENPEKYSFIRDIGYSLDDYAAATDTEKDAFTWAYNNPEKYLVSRAVSDDLFTYRSYTGDLNDIKADKDADGKSISGSRKDKVVDYLNGLDIDYGAKIILLKSEYPSEDSYNYDIIDYLNEREDITAEEMTVILTQLGFRVTSDGTITWD